MNLSFNVFYSEPDQNFVGVCNQFPSLSCFNESKELALLEILWIIYDELKDDYLEKKITGKDANLFKLLENN